MEIPVTACPDISIYLLEGKIVNRLKHHAIILVKLATPKEIIIVCHVLKMHLEH